VDGLLEKGRRTIDVEQRKRIYRRLHEIMAEEQPCVFLYNADGLFIAQKRIQNIAPSPLGIYNKVPKFFISQ
jgi:peptide/nickel transport system substrate-binding protein